MANTMLETHGMDRRTLADLFAIARLAHDRGARWADFWPTVRADVQIMAAGDSTKRQRLVDRLLAVVGSGDMDGIEPPTSDIWGDGQVATEAA